MTEDVINLLLECDPEANINNRLRHAAYMEITHLRDAAENLVIAIGMGWDLGGVVEKMQEALGSIKGEN